MLLWNIFVTWYPKMTELASSVSLNIISKCCLWNYFSEILKHRNVNSNILSFLCSSGLPNLQRITQSGFGFEKDCKHQIVAFWGKEEDACYSSYWKIKWHHHILTDAHWDWLCLGYKEKTCREMEFQKLFYSCKRDETWQNHLGLTSTSGTHTSKNISGCLISRHWDHSSQITGSAYITKNILGFMLAWSKMEFLHRR